MLSPFNEIKYKRKLLFTCVIKCVSIHLRFCRKSTPRYDTEFSFYYDCAHSALESSSVLVVLNGTEMNRN